MNQFPKTVYIIQDAVSRQQILPLPIREKADAERVAAALATAAQLTVAVVQVTEIASFAPLAQTPRPTLVT